MEAQHRAITSELDASTQSWADVAASAQRHHTYPPACHDHRDVVDMPHRSTHTNHRKSGSLTLKLQCRLSAIAKKIFAITDADARRHGWEVTVTDGGFGRRYRDPRFNYLANRTACHGRGRNPNDGICSACHGTGRVVLDPSAASQPGPGRP